MSYSVIDGIFMFVKAMSVDVVSCFEVKSRLRRKAGMGDDDDDGHKAFRLCIHAKDAHRLMNPEAWPDSVMISEWYFKQPRNVAVEDQSNRRQMAGNDDCVLNADEARVADPEPPPPAPFQIADSPIRYAESTGATAVAVADVEQDNDKDNYDGADRPGDNATVTDDDTLLYQDAATTVH